MNNPVNNMYLAKTITCQLKLNYYNYKTVYYKYIAFTPSMPAYCRHCQNVRQYGSDEVVTLNISMEHETTPCEMHSLHYDLLTMCIHWYRNQCVHEALCMCMMTDCHLAQYRWGLHTEYTEQNHMCQSRVPLRLSSLL